MVKRAILLLAACLLTAPAPALAQQGGAPKVTVAQPLEAQVVDSSEFTGRFYAVESVSIQAQVTGYLAQIDFVDGQMVNAGDQLFLIDPQIYEAAVAQARADVLAAQSRANLARLELDRGEQLVGSGALSQESVDSRRAAYESAAAEVAAAQARLQSTQVDLSYTRITAPISGRISATALDIGNLVQGGSGAVALTSIVSVDPVHFVFEMSEGEYLAYSDAFGTSLQARADDHAIPTSLRLLNETAFDRQGEIDFVDNAFEASTGTIRIRAVVPNPDRTLVPGLFGKLRLATSQPYQALLIPDRAILSDQANRIVMVVGAEDKVEARPIEPGPLYRGLRVINSGLKPGDRVIVDGLLLARPGQAVTTEDTTVTFDDAS